MEVLNRREPSLVQVNGALTEELKDIHALSIKKVWTPAQQQQQQQAAAATAE